MVAQTRSSHSMNTSPGIVTPPQQAERAKKIPENTLPAYKPPTRGILSWLPASWVPYAQLMRLDKPAGNFAFYFPHLFGLLFAQATTKASRSVEQQAATHFYIAIGSLLLRGAACTWNDMLDAPYDRQVARCRLRPVARYAVSQPAALLFTAAQTALGVGLTLTPLPRECYAPAAFLTATQVVYPLFKRFTNYPQVWLGASFAFGLGVGAGAGGVDVGNILASFAAGTTNGGKVNLFQGVAALAADDRRVLGSLVCLFAVCVLNTLIYDTIYGHQDLADDIKAGVKSVAVAWREKTKRNCAVLAVAEVGLLVLTSRIAGLGFGFDALAVGGTAFVLTTMLYRVNLDDPSSCMWCFNWLIWGTGVTLTLGLASSCIDAGMFQYL